MIGITCADMGKHKTPFLTLVLAFRFVCYHRFGVAVFASLRGRVENTFNITLACLARCDGQVNKKVEVAQMSFF